MGLRSLGEKLNAPIQFQKGRRMWGVLCCITLSITAFVHQPTYAQNQLVRTQKNFDREPLQPLLYVPKQDTSVETKRLPLLLFLHGGGEGGSNIDKVKTHGDGYGVSLGTRLVMEESRWVRRT
jgi:hypothetical protein